MTAARHRQRHPSEVVDWTDLGREMWSFLTGREAAINYRFIDMAVEVPRDTGARGPARDLEAQRHPAGHHEGQREPARAAPEPMPTDLTVDADLEFSVDIPGARTVTRLADRLGQDTSSCGSATRSCSPGGPTPAPIRGLADGARPSRGLSDRRGLRAGPLVTLGAPRTSWLQRRVTGSRHIRIERGAGLWSLVRGRAQAPRRRRPAGGRAGAAGHLCPVAPTLRTATRPPVTTTHDPRRGREPPADPGRRGAIRGRATDRTVFRLRDDVTTIGSRRRLRHPAGRARAAARRGPARRRTTSSCWSGSVARADTRVNGAPVRHARSCAPAPGSSSASWTMTFYREEYADHGRPYGGRVGGELGHQRPQPSRAPLPAQHVEEHASDLAWTRPGRRGLRLRRATPLPGADGGRPRACGP